MEKAEETPKPDERQHMSKDYADGLHLYQEDHRNLMNSLRDETVSDEDFERMSDEAKDNLNSLKRARTILGKLRQVITRRGDGESDQPPGSA